PLLDRWSPLPKGRDLSSLTKEIRSDRDRVEDRLESWSHSANPLTSEVSRYVLRKKGKRLRPALVLLTSRLFSPGSEESVFLASLVELIHTASLIHDDIVDNSGTRRGRPSVHSVWGPNVTVLLGDYLFIRSIGLALRSGDDRIIRLLADLSARMIEGELTEYAHGGDLGIPESRYYEIIDMKTASLFTAAARIGGMLGKLPPGDESALAEAGRNLGMAFQIVDDLLDFGGDAGAIGKPVLSDLAEGRITLPLIHALNDGAGGSSGRLAGMVGRKDLDASARDEVLAILRGSGSLDYAYGKARAYVDDARVLLGRFPESPARRAMFRFADLVLERER
ncbi:MAG TPA: polyprenyl synthetase family protein, partial [Acidobacteriota bacterium]|nr:polyprenyl synthetase family protein [Acidobacteriota bacterium]